MRWLAILVLTSLTPLRADVLVNSSFADGRAHWKGDAEDVDASNSLDPGAGGSGQSGGVVITLKKDKWSKIYQTFNVHDATLYYTITFKFSEDYKIAPNGDDESKPDFSDVPGVWDGWRLPESEWFLMVTGCKGADFGAQKYLTPNPKKNPQTLTGKFSDMADGADGVILLAIPPGTGKVTFLKIALSPTDPNAEP